MTKNKHPTICYRCGRGIAPGAGTVSKLKSGTSISEHTYCSKMFRGTGVHYKTQPSSIAPVEVYTHQHENGRVDLYNVSGLKSAISRVPHEKVQLAVDSSFAEMLCEKNEVDPVNAYQIAMLREREGKAEEPVLVVYLHETGDHLMIDGNHRVVGHVMNGKVSVPALVFHRYDLSAYVMEDVGHEFIKDYAV